MVEAPKNIIIIRESAHILIKWDRVPGAIKYKIYISEKSNEESYNEIYEVTSLDAEGNVDTILLLPPRNKNLYIKTQAITSEEEGLLSEEQVSLYAIS